MAQQEKEVSLDKDNILTLVGSTPLQYKLPFSYFNIIFSLCLISAKENYCYLMTIFALYPQSISNKVQSDSFKT